VRAPEDLHGTRIIAAPAVLDAVAVPGIRDVIRLAADDLFLLGNYKFIHTGPDALIQEDETGFVGWWLNPNELEHVGHHIDWPLTPGLNQGLVAGVPAKVWLGPDRCLLLVARAYAHELEARL